MEVKNYRVRTRNGSFIIQATNIQDAMKKAKKKFGVLPNEKRSLALTSLLNNLNKLTDDISMEIKSIKESGKQYDWDNLSVKIKKLSTQLKDSSTFCENTIKKLKG